MGSLPGTFEPLPSTRPSVDSLSKQLVSAQPLEMHEAVLHLRQRFDEGQDDIHALAALVPTSTWSGFAPETQRELARLVLSGLPVPVPPPPETLPLVVRLDWTRAALLTDAALLDSLDGTALGDEAVRDLPVERVLSRGLLDRLLQARAPGMRRAALGYLRSGLEQALLPPAQAQTALLTLARGSRPALAAEALTLLAQAWAVDLPCPPLPDFLSREDESASAAVQVLGSRRAVGELRRLALDEHLAPRLHHEVLVALGKAGTREAFRPLLERALADPARFGAPALEALVLLRRRGLSPSAEEAYSVLGLYLENPTLSPALAAEVLSSRAETVLSAFDTALLSEAPNAVRWILLLEVLETRGARERLIALVVSEEARPYWTEAIHALGRMEAHEAEPVLLRRLPEAPESCLFALNRVGGAATVEALKAVLAHAGAERPAWFTRAARVLVEMDPGPSTFARVAREELLTPELVLSLPAQASALEFEVLAGLARRPGDPRREAAIDALGRTGGPLAIDVLAELLTDPDEASRQQAHEALRDLGRRLQTLGADRPACISDAKDPGAALLAEGLLRRVERGGLLDEELFWLLDALRGLAHPRLVRAVRPLLRRRDPEVRKRVVACLATAGEAASAWLLPLLDEEELLVTRQVLRVLGELGATGAAERVAEALEHPNMNLKKTAAESLTHLGDARVSGQLLSWLARHHNPGLRESLRTALRASTGPWWRSRVVEALDAATEPRARELLCEVFDGALTPADVGVLVSRPSDWRPVLLTLIQGGRVALARGAPIQLDAELVRRNLVALLPTVKSVPPSSDLRPGLQAIEAARNGQDVRRRLQERPTTCDREFMDLLGQAKDPGAVSIESLTWEEARGLFTLHSQVDEHARTGIEALLRRTRTPAAAQILGMLSADTRDLPPDRWDVASARAHLTAPEAARRQRAAHVAALDLTPGAPELRDLQPEAALAWMVDTGAHDELARWSLEGPGPQPEVCARALVRHEGTPATLRILQNWLERFPAHAERLVPALLCLGDEAEETVRALIGSTRLEARARVRLLEGLRERPSEVNLGFLRQSLEDRALPVRKEAARQLLARGGVEDRHRVLATLLTGALGEDFSFVLTDSEYPALATWMRGSHTEHEGLAALALLTSGEDTNRAPLLLDAWRSPHARVRARARELLRQVAPAHVLPSALPHLRAGGWEWLDVLGGDGAVPPELVRVAAEAPDAVDAWGPAFLRLAGPGLLYAPGLLSPLLEALRREPSELRLRLIARLTDWYEPERATRLCQALGALLTGAARPRLFDTVLEATRALPPSWTVRLVSGLAHPTDDAAVEALLDAVLKVPALREGLPEALRSQVEARLVQEAGAADAERVRRILTHLAGTARSEREKEDVVALLERSLGHRQARVRHQAHRLLAKHAPRERYLRATHALLTDTDPHTVRRGIRVLSFGGQAEVTPMLAGLLSHREPLVRRAAREGLLVLGPKALTPLTKASAHVRPDHREAVLDVIEELRARDG